MKQHVTIDISLSAIFKVLAVIFGLWLIWMIRDIAILFFFVIIIVMALAPIIDQWQKTMPRSLAVALLFIIVLGVIGLTIGLLIPPVVTQVSELAMNLPGYANKIQLTLAGWGGGWEGVTSAQRILQTLSDQLSQLSSGLIQTTIGILGGVVTFFTAIILSIYLLIEEKGIRNFFVSLIPVEHKLDIVNAINKVGDKLGSWLRGQLLLMVIIGVATAIWTSILGVPYWLALSLWAGLTEVIPFVGPFLGGIPIILITFIDSPWKALIAIILLIVTQQLESNFIVPKVMQRSVGLSPVVVILALLIGGKLFGIPGTILSVPVAAAVSVVIQDWPKISKALYREK